MCPEAKSILQDGLAELGVVLEEQKLEKLLCYLGLLEKWNRSFNLTAIRDPQEMIYKHLLDCLACLPVMEQDNFQTLCDVGSGAGLPGIPLAIARPDWHVTLIDSNTKKTGFLQQVKTELKLVNVTVVGARVEALKHKTEAVISRAFSSLPEMLVAVIGLCETDTIVWAMKGRPSNEELLAIKKPYRVCASHKLVVPGVLGERHLIKLVNESTTPQ